VKRRFFLTTWSRTWSSPCGTRSASILRSCGSSASAASSSFVWHGAMSRSGKSGRSNELVCQFHACKIQGLLTSVACLFLALLVWGSNIFYTLLLAGFLFSTKQFFWITILTNQIRKVFKNPRQIQIDVCLSTVHKRLVAKLETLVTKWEKLVAKLDRWMGCFDSVPSCITAALCMEFACPLFLQCWKKSCIF